MPVGHAECLRAIGATSWLAPSGPRGRQPKYVGELILAALTPARICPGWMVPGKSGGKVDQEPFPRSSRRAGKPGRQQRGKGSTPLPDKEEGQEDVCNLQDFDD